jgi:hypothetical protein
MFDATGRISLQIMRSTLPKFASNKRQEGTPEENKAIVQGLLCFFGTYSVNETDHILNLHIESSSFPNWNGINQSDLSPSLGMKGRTSSAMMQPDRSCRVEASSVSIAANERMRCTGSIDPPFQ